MLSCRDVRKGIRKRPPSLQARGPELRVWQAHRNVMNDTVVTECLEHPDAEHEHKARSNDRDPVRRTSSRPADVCAAPKGRTYDRSRPNRSTRRRKRLPWGRSLIAPPLSMVLLPPRVTVLSAVGIIRRNIWSEAQVQCSLIAPPLSMVLLPPRVTVLSAVGIIRRNIWSEAQVLQCPQRADVQ
jgi:hypothetical protein